MIEDEVVREVRAVREAFAAQHGFSIRAMAAYLQKLDAAGDRVVVSFPPRPVVQPHVIVETSKSLPRPEGSV